MVRKIEPLSLTKSDLTNFLAISDHFQRNFFGVRWVWDIAGGWGAEGTEGTEGAEGAEGTEGTKEDEGAANYILLDG